MPKSTKPPTYKTGQTAVAQYVGRLDSLVQRFLAVWAALCAEHVLPYFEREHPADDRPRRAIEAARAWVRGEIRCGAARAAAVAAHAAARACTHPAAIAVARATGHAAATAHMLGHARGTAAYAITATASASPDQSRPPSTWSSSGSCSSCRRRPGNLAMDHEHEKPNPATSGHGAMALLFQLGRLRRAVPEQRRCAVTKYSVFVRSFCLNVLRS
jgi:hypothetical protein